MTAHNLAISQSSGVAAPSSLRPDLQAIADLIPLGKRVLDLGCGDGELLSYLIANRQSKGRGIEISEAGVLACVSKGLSVRQGRVPTSPWAQSSRPSLSGLAGQGRRAWMVA